MRRLVSDADEVVGETFDDGRRLGSLEGSLIHGHEDRLLRLHNDQPVRLSRVKARCVVGSKRMGWDEHTMRMARDQSKMVEKRGGK